MGQPIIADHKAVQQFDQIPDYWINEIKKMMINIPGESHGRGYMYGLELLEDLDSIYAVNITWTGEPEGNTETHLRGVRTYRNKYGQWSENGGEQHFYTSQLAIDLMKTHLDYMRNTLNNPVSVFMFGWCWDMTWHNGPGGTKDPVYYVHWAGSSVGGPEGDLRWGLDESDVTLTGNSVSMQTYLNAVDEYNEFDSLTRTVFTTGPIDNNSANENGYQRYLKHNFIVNYVNNNLNSILFDYADILSYNNNGEQYINPTGWTDYNGIHHTYPTIHPDNDGNYDGGKGGCHLNEAGCIRLAKAMWWMLARIAGWQIKTESQTIPSGDPSVLIFEQTQVAMDFSNSPGGEVNVDLIFSNPPNVGSLILPKYWDITSTMTDGTFNLDLQFSYNDDDTSGLNENALIPVYYDDINSRWKRLLNYSLDTTNNTMTIHNLDHFTIFAMGQLSEFDFILSDVKIYLEGPFNISAMSTTLLTRGFIPLSQPYNVSPWNYTGEETLAAIPDEIVDWILVELRTGPEASTQITFRAAFLRSDGSIVDLDGISPIGFDDITANSYYLLVHHRNHLAVMTSSMIALNQTGSTLYNFSTGISNYYESTGAIEIETGMWGMISGDGNHDGGVYGEDYTLYRLNQGAESYHIADFNMDGGVYGEDYTIYRLNQGLESSVPKY